MNNIPQSLSIDLTQSLTQDKINEIKAFSAGLESNKRIHIGLTDGDTIVFSRQTEPNKEKKLRQVGNLLGKLKNNAAIKRDLSVLVGKTENGGDWGASISHIHAHVSKKFHVGQKITLSTSNFQSLIDPIANKLVVPVFDKLKEPSIKLELNALNFKNKTDPCESPEVQYMSGPGEDPRKVADEFRSFFNFAKHQAEGQSGNYRDSKALDFAKRWDSYKADDEKGLKRLFGEKKFHAISQAAAELLAFASRNNSNKTAVTISQHPAPTRP